MPLKRACYTHRSQEKGPVRKNKVSQEAEGDGEMWARVWFPQEGIPQQGKQTEDWLIWIISEGWASRLSLVVWYLLLR